MTFLKNICLSVMALLMLTLMGCDDSNKHQELIDWMIKQKEQTAKTIPPVYPPVPFVAAPYLGGMSLDPFDDQKLRNVLKSLNSSNGNALKPDLSRKKEILEGYPLDNIKMIGFIMRQSKPTAIVSAGGTLFNVIVGNYAGQDFGQIISITEQEIAFKEKVQDGSGAWVERVTKLPLTLAGKDFAKDNKK